MTPAELLPFCRNDFKNKAYYKYNDILVIEYIDDGKEYKSLSEISFTTKRTSYQMYAYCFEEVDGYDIGSVGIKEMEKVTAKQKVPH